jgi:hypothetical protein
MRRRLLASLGAAILLVAGPLAFAAASLHRAGDDGRAHAALAAELSRIERRIGASAGAGISPAEDDLCLSGATRALAGAELHRRVAAIIASGGIGLEEFEYLEPEAAGNDEKLRLRVAFTADMPALQRILFQVEQSRPAMLVRAISLRGKVPDAPDPHASIPLRTVLQIEAYWRRAA